MKTKVSDRYQWVAAVLCIASKYTRNETHGGLPKLLVYLIKIRWVKQDVAGQTHEMAQCNICSNSQHSNNNCTVSPDPDLDVAMWLWALESAVLALVCPTIQEPLSRMSSHQQGCFVNFELRGGVMLHNYKGCGLHHASFQCCEWTLSLTRNSLNTYVLVWRSYFKCYWIPVQALTSLSGLNHQLEHWRTKRLYKWRMLD